MGWYFWLAAVIGGAFFCAQPAGAQIQADFHLLTWDDSQATGGLPTGVGRKPSAGRPTNGDWLVFTADDESLAAGYNPYGALSHNFADMPGLGGSAFDNAPSLSGTISMQFADAGAGAWDISVTGLSYAGQATPMMQMNQFLVTAGSNATLDPKYGVDGLGNNGMWSGSQAGNWEVQYVLDFYFATNADGNPSPDDIDLTFSNKTQKGYLIPVSELTLANLSGMDDPAGFFSGNFAQYIMDEIKPRLPGNAEYLLITQMDKTHPAYAEGGLPVTTSSLIGNTTFAYTTSAIPEPAAAGLLVGGLVWLGLRRRRSR